MLGCPEESAAAVSTLTTSGLETPYYISLWNGNKGNSLLMPDIWVNVIGSIVPENWVAILNYVRGRLVKHRGGVWLALTGTKGVEPG